MCALVQRSGVVTETSFSRQSNLLSSRRPFRALARPAMSEPAEDLSKLLVADLKARCKAKSLSVLALESSRALF